MAPCGDVRGTRHGRTLRTPEDAEVVVNVSVVQPQSQTYDGLPDTILLEHPCPSGTPEIHICICNFQGFLRTKTLSTKAGRDDVWTSTSQTQDNHGLNVQTNLDPPKMIARHTSDTHPKSVLAILGPLTDMGKSHPEMQTQLFRNSVLGGLSYGVWSLVENFLYLTKISLAARSHVNS